MKRIVTAIFAAILMGVAAFLFWQQRASFQPGPAMRMSGPLSSPSFVGKLTFLALGDSYTIGQSVPPGDRWPVQLAKKLRGAGIDISDPVIIARTGWTTGDLLAAIDRADLKSNFNLVTLMIGVNNEFQGRSEEEYRRQFRELLKRSIALAGGKASHVIVLSIPDWTATPFGAQYDVKRMSAEVDRFNAICREESAKTSAQYVDVTRTSREVKDNPDFVADDGLHPSGKQYAAWIKGIDVEAIGLRLETTQPSTRRADR
jgi:lysophospholipase L1-like esterase